MTAYSHANLYSVAVPEIACDSWGHIRLGNGTTTAVLQDGVGVSGVRYLSTGTHGVSFSVPNSLGGGGYVVIYTPEVKDHTIPILVTGLRRSVGSEGSTAAGTTNGIRFVTSRFPGPAVAGGNTAQAGDFIVGGANDEGVHLNFAVFGMKTNNDLRVVRVANYARDSEDFTTSSNYFRTTNIASLMQSDSQIIPPEYKSNSSPVTKMTGTGGSEYIGQSVSSVNKTWNWSMYARAGTGRTLEMTVGGAGNNFGCFFDLGRTSGNGGVTVFNVPVGATLTSANMQHLHSGWKRCSFSFSTPNIPAPLFRPMSPNMANLDLYVWGFQMEEGSVATPYIKTGSVVPVLGNQDVKKSLVPNSAGFGVTGATYNSVIPALVSKRIATAYGTIVVPPATSNVTPPIAYVEDSFNVKGVSASSNSVFDITFTTPLTGSTYCVILSSENEPLSAATPDYAQISEYSMLLVGREFKNRNGFRAIVLKQNSTDNSWIRQSTPYQAGFRQKIHFMVFGGGTYGSQ